MTWARIDDQFYMTLKNARIDRDEQDLCIASWVYCNSQLTDGFIPKPVLPMLAVWAKLPNEANVEAIASRLVEHEYWELVDGGYRVHDFLDWNKSKEEVLALREVRSDAGKRGGRASGAARKAKAEANEAKREAIAEAKTKQKRTPYPYSINQETTTNDVTDIAWSRAIKTFENEIGLVSGSILPDMLDMWDVLTSGGMTDWWDKSITIAVAANKRSWSYVRGILNRCLTSGQAPVVSTNGNGNGKHEELRPAETDAAKVLR